jgi:TRAP-type C4-dicarboxylate transport system permease large subunit
VITSASPDVVTGVADTFLGAGIAGAIALVAIAFFWIAWKREAARADAERAAKDALVREFMDRVVPALVESTRVQRDFVDMARERAR